MTYVAPADPGRGDPLGLLQPFADVLDRAARQGLAQVDAPLVTVHLLGAALGASLCGAIVYGAPPARPGVGRGQAAGPARARWTR